MSTSESTVGVAGQVTSVPGTLEGLLERIGTAQAAIYHLVRQMLDDLEQAAPWDDLYYPPADKEEFLRKATLMLAVIEGIPQRVTRQIEQIEAPGVDAETDELLGDMSFFFNGIHMSVEQEIRKLRAVLERFGEDGEDLEPSPEERDFTCELLADLKGKYSSSIMGAAASLIAGGQWRGVEIEPVLFPEKAKEFERNERLVETLSEVTENIHNLLEQVPLARLVQQWGQEKRVDQYVLTPLYSLLGNLGKLMQETSRRALYSGDYHQIQRREGLLASRVNELATLHNMTWGTVPKPPDQTEADLFAKMVRSATELAAVLHIDILKKIIGGAQVETLLRVVIVEKELNSAVDRWRRGQEIQPHPNRAKVPEEQHSLIVLLYDEDLHTFLELLLGSVLKRASLTVRREMEQAVAARAAEAAEAAAQAEAAVTEAAPAQRSAAELAGELDPLLDSIQVMQPEELAAQYGSPPAAQPGTPVSPGVSTPGPSTPVPSTPGPSTPGPSTPGQAIPGSTIPGSTIPSPGSPSGPVPGPTFDSAFDPVPAVQAQPGQAPQWLPAGDSEAPTQEIPTGRGAWDSTTLDAELDSLSTPDFEGFPGVEPPSFGGGQDVDVRQQALQLLGQVEQVIDRLTAPSTPSLRSFQLIQRLLKQKRTIPPAMMQSMQPYLRDITDELLPSLTRPQLVGRFAPMARQLAEDCQLLGRPELSTELLRGPVPQAMERIHRQLAALRIQVAEAIGEVSGY